MQANVPVSLGCINLDQACYVDLRNEDVDRTNPKDVLKLRSSPMLVVVEHVNVVPNLRARKSKIENVETESSGKKI